MEISRRTFLNAAVAGATAMAIGDPTFAAAKDQHITDVENLLDMHDRLVGMVVSRKEFNAQYADPADFIDGKEFRRARSFSLRKGVTYEEYASLFDNICECILNRFAPPEADTPAFVKAKAEIDYLFEYKTIEGFREVPPVLSPPTIGVATMFSLLTIHRLRFPDLNHAKHIDSFFDVFQGIIINDDEKAT